MSTAVNVNSLPSKLTIEVDAGARNLGAGAKWTDFLANAREAYGEALPEWVEALAIEANRTTGAAAGRRIGYSGSVVTSVCKATYAGDIGAVEAKVRGALMGATLECPVLGEIGRDRCLDEQKKRHVATSAVRTALFHACRSGCQHSRLKSEGGHDA
jgi:hypothetical protein